MRFPGKATVAGLSLSLTAGTAWGADVCARAPDLVALQIAALQQQLMVAALTCDDVPLYNSFVTAYQKDLVASDEALQAFFDRFGSEEGTPAYHSFKTKMANLYSGAQRVRQETVLHERPRNIRSRAEDGEAESGVICDEPAVDGERALHELRRNCRRRRDGDAHSGCCTDTAEQSLDRAECRRRSERRGDCVCERCTADGHAFECCVACHSSFAPPSAAAAETKQTAQLNNSQAANSDSNQRPAQRHRGEPPITRAMAWGMRVSANGLGSRLQAGQENDTAKTADAANSGDQAASANSNQQREVTRSARSRSASEAYRERLAQQRAARERAAQRPSVRYRDRNDARGYYWPADPYWQYCYTRYGVRLSCAEAAQRFRNDRYYYRAPYDDGGYYPSR